MIEQVFALPGIGRLVVQGILARDYPLVQGVMLIYGFAFVAVNLTVDILYTFADPRVRYDRTSASVSPRPSWRRAGASCCCGGCWRIAPSRSARCC